MTQWFISDTHFSHQNIIKYSKRPFEDIHHMNESLIANWNTRVLPNDEIYHLGDFGFGDTENLQKIFDRLNGRRFLILGNHDKNSQKMTGWEWIRHYHELHVKRDGHNGSSTIILFHYAMRVWNKAHHGAIQLYGHSHGNMPGNSQSLDVGVDCWDYRPINLKQIEARLSTLTKFTGYAIQAGGSDHHSGDI
jgi:calcineurin-like phosphoesterase family protein